MRPSSCSQSNCSFDFVVFLPFAALDLSPVSNLRSAIDFPAAAVFIQIELLNLLIIGVASHVKWEQEGRTNKIICDCDVKRQLPEFFAAHRIGGRAFFVSGDFRLFSTRKFSPRWRVTDNKHQTGNWANSDLLERWQLPDANLCKLRLMHSSSRDRKRQWKLSKDVQTTAGILLTPVS